MIRRELLVKKSIKAVWLYLFIFLIPSESDAIHLRLKIENFEQGIFLPTTINGLSYKLLFDTGATYTVLDKSFKPLLGKPIDRNIIETPAKNQQIDFYSPVEIYIDDINISTKHPVLASDFSFLEKVVGAKFYGVLGMAVLHKYTWDIDFDEGIVTVNSVFSNDVIRKEYELIPILISSQGVPTLPVTLSERLTHFILDTGDQGFGRLTADSIDFLISQNLVESVALDSMVTLSGVSKMRVVRIKQIEIGETLFKNVLMTESLQNSIGLGFLRRHHTILDFPDKKIYLKEGLGSFLTDQADKSGLKLLSHNSKLLVAFVDSQGPASGSGIKQGDFIAGINGENVTGDDLQAARRLLKGNEGSSVSLNVLRNDKQLNLTFSLEEGFNHLNPAKW